jgi:hypothetical protein
MAQPFFNPIAAPLTTRRVTVEVFNPASTRVYRRLNDHITTHKILLPQQFGFQKGLSTEEAIYKLTNIIHTAWNRKEYAVGIFCDVAKAFDCVDHELLLMKLQYYGV